MQTRHKFPVWVSLEEIMDTSGLYSLALLVMVNVLTCWSLWDFCEWLKHQPFLLQKALQPGSFPEDSSEEQVRTQISQLIEWTLSSLYVASPPGRSLCDVQLIPCKNSTGTVQRIHSDQVGVMTPAVCTVCFSRENTSDARSPAVCNMWQRATGDRAKLWFS